MLLIERSYNLFEDKRILHTPSCNFSHITGNFVNRYSWVKACNFDMGANPGYNCFLLISVRYSNLLLRGSDKL